MASSSTSPQPHGSSIWASAFNSFQNMSPKHKSLSVAGAALTTVVANIFLKGFSYALTGSSARLFGPYPLLGRVAVIATVFGIAAKAFFPGVAQTDQAEPARPSKASEADRASEAGEARLPLSGAVKELNTAYTNLMQRYVFFQTFSSTRGGSEDAFNFYRNAFLPHVKAFVMSPERASFGQGNEKSKWTRFINGRPGEFKTAISIYSGNRKGWAEAFLAALPRLPYLDSDKGETFAFLDPEERFQWLRKALFFPPQIRFTQTWSTSSSIKPVLCEETSALLKAFEGVMNADVKSGKDIKDKIPKSLHSLISVLMLKQLHLGFSGFTKISGEAQTFNEVPTTEAIIRGITEGYTALISPTEVRSDLWGTSTRELRDKLVCTIGRYKTCKVEGLPTHEAPYLGDVLKDIERNSDEKSGDRWIDTTIKGQVLGLVNAENFWDLYTKLEALPEKLSPLKERFYEEYSFLRMLPGLKAMPEGILPPSIDIGRILNAPLSTKDALEGSLDLDYIWTVPSTPEKGGG